MKHQETISVNYKRDHFAFQVAIGFVWIIAPVAVKTWVGLGFALGVVSAYILAIWVLKTNSLQERDSYLLSMVLVLVPFDAISVFANSLSLVVNAFHLIGNIFIGCLLIKWLKPFETRNKI